MMEDGANPAAPRARISREMIKGGPSLCANYCREYRRTAGGYFAVPRWTLVDRQAKVGLATELMPRLI
jgi:hypothetical protein